ncbi:MAG: GspH/FimT family protein, partial [Pseudomonadota bacterium]
LVVPSFSDLLLDSRRAAAMNSFVRAVHLARSESAKLSRPIVLCKTTNLETCAPNNASWDLGWLIFAPALGDLEATAPLLRQQHWPGLEITSNRNRFTFHPFHRRRQTNGTITFCDRRGPIKARAVIISYTGRPRVDSVAPGGRALRCRG